VSIADLERGDVLVPDGFTSGAALAST